uniref:Uncharacterized protein n=1 Tax=Glossina palpalis gambiensis TaxID=67801 RepID=A0A1B0BW53_9MUSC
YALTAGSDVEDIETFYLEITRTLQLTKTHDLHLIMRNFNANAGEEHVFKIYNTFFRLPLRPLYTEKFPQEVCQNGKRNQIDYVLKNKSFGTKASVPFQEQM